jgi:signal transduction histidine kinase
MATSPVPVLRAERAGTYRLRAIRLLWYLTVLLVVVQVTGAVYAAADQLSNPSPATRSALGQLGWLVPTYAALHAASACLLLLGFLVVAGIIVWQRWDDWMAVFVSIFLISFGGVYGQLILLPEQQRANAALNALPAWALLNDLYAYICYTSLGVIFYLFPDGRFVPRFTRFLAAGMVLLQIPWSLLPASQTPDTWPAGIGVVLTLLVWAGGPLSQVYRYRFVSGPTERQQTKWVVFGLAATLFIGLSILLPASFLPSSHPLSILRPVVSLLFLLVPLTIGVAVLRYRLWGIDLVVNRALVYVGLSAGVASIYIVAVGYLGALFGNRNNLLVSLLATGTVAAAFQPLRAHVQRGVNRLMYGDRDDPYGVLARLGRQLEAALAPDAVFSTIVGAVKDALKLPYVAIALAPSADVVAAAGSVTPDVLRLPLTYQGTAMGEFLLAPRVPGEAWAAADRRLLDALAQQAGVALHAARLARDLQQSRERLVLTREEERRRLRRDLHDDLAPSLAALALGVSTAADLVTADPTAATSLLRQLEVATRATVGEVRRLVYDLRPPALDELGLLEAIRDRARQWSGHGLAITVEGPDDLPPLPAAVEVAAYRIIQEAVMNVVRHAAAQHCAIRLATATGLEIEVEDDGAGLPPQHAAGVGLRSMRERAEELGGVLTIQSEPGQGTTVRAQLPC